MRDTSKWLCGNLNSHEVCAKICALSQQDKQLERTPPMILKLRTHCGLPSYQPRKDLR